MATNKTQPTSQSAQDFIDSVPDPIRRADAKEILDIMTRATGEEAKMWGPSIVGFGMYHYKYESGREGDTVAVGFSPRKPALVLYGLFHYDENKENIELASKLGPHTSGKGCLYIKKLADVDKVVLINMIKSAYTARNNSSA